MRVLTCYIYDTTSGNYEPLHVGIDVLAPHMTVQTVDALITPVNPGISGAQVLPGPNNGHVWAWTTPEGAPNGPDGPKGFQPFSGVDDSELDGLLNTFAVLATSGADAIERDDSPRIG
jgi:hypothetical protein